MTLRSFPGNGDCDFRTSKRAIDWMMNFANTTRPHGALSPANSTLPRFAEIIFDVSALAANPAGWGIGKKASLIQVPLAMEACGR
jgi:hypothetical protein